MTDVGCSVILVHWNTPDLLLEALRSVRSDANFSNVAVESIVVDNGSEGDWLIPLEREFPEAKVVRNERNLGFARAVNMGLEVSSGPFVLLLNTDAILRNGATRSLLEAFKQDTAIGIAGGALENPDGSPQNSFAPFPTLATELCNKSLLRFLFPGKHRRKVPPSADRPFEVDSVIGACLAVRRETLNAIGPLDERFFFFFEETDWCFQARQLGWKVATVPEARIVHGQGKSSELASVDVRIEHHRSRYRYFLKNHGRTKSLLLFEGMLVKLMAETVFALLGVILSFGRSEKWRGRLRTVATVLGWHIRGCPRRWGLEGRQLGPTDPSDQ